MPRTVPLDWYRNIGILAGPDAGRTTTTERILSVSARDAAARGVSGAAGGLPAWIEQDNTREITLTSAATSCDWRDYRINIVELPAADRLGEGALSVLDGAIVVIDAVTGTGPAVEAALAEAAGRGIARLVFVNKLDRAGADLGRVVDRIAGLNVGEPLLLQQPIGAGQGLQGLIDLVAGTVTLWREAPFDAPGEDMPIPPELVAQASEGRAKVVAAVARGAERIDARHLNAHVRAAVLGGNVLPVVCGSAFRNRGIRGLLDAVVDYLPAPSEVALKAVAWDGHAIERHGSDEEPFAGLAFQTVDDPAVGKLTFVRIYSGVVATGGQMLNSVSASPERISRMVRMHANHTEEVIEARAGDIVAVEGLEHTTTGDTLCDPAAPVILERKPASAGHAKH